MKTDTPQTIFLKDYKKPDYKISHIDLIFELHDTETLVTSEMKFSLNTENNQSPEELFLNGEELKLVSLEMNNVNLEEGKDFRLSTEGMTLLNPPEEFQLTVKNIINPQANTALDGLYKSSDMFCTQNEPQGFRRITYFLDRPDNLSLFTTKIIADKKNYPTLLSNGNPTGSGELADGKHWVSWADPFPKPCYLYALVAGDFDLLEDEYTTGSGRKILLQIFCDKGEKEKCHHAMESLKKSMQWDEDRFGLEYDLDIYMIVAASSFNMGAMENKGLNIFNSALVLADPKTATDNDFMRIESVIGHEYFHNWTGNRVTCRDWFQLTLKEGLTVFRDQEFSSDMNSRVVQRVGDVRGLRDHQFVEDAGPTSHPIKPSSYIEINNFYTATIYEKGAEVIRMIHTLLGEEGFRKGIDKYFELHDGQAVTTEDFINAMSSANSNYDFTQFKNWYTQSGTPHVKVKTYYDADEKTYTLNFTQTCPPTPGQNVKEPFVIPMKFALMDHHGEDLKLETDMITLREKTESRTFQNIEKRPILSLNRGFSAPVILDVDERPEDFSYKMRFDKDPFNRYEAAQELAKMTILELMQDQNEGRELKVSPIFVESFGKVLMDEKLDNSIKNMTLSMPSEISLHRLQQTIDFEQTHKIREFLKDALVNEFQEEMIKLYEGLQDDGGYDLSPCAVGRRALRNHLMSFIVLHKDPFVRDIAYNQFNEATNMTDQITALQNIVHYPGMRTQECLQKFYDQWNSEELVMQKWISVQASSPQSNTIERIHEIEKMEIYDEKIPNFFRSLFGVFAHNFVNFHQPSGKGYEMMAERVIRMNAINPQMAARLIGSFKDYKHLNKDLKPLMKEQLNKILNLDGLSKNVYEIASKISGE